MRASIEQHLRMSRGEACVLALLVCVGIPLLVLAFLVFAVGGTSMQASFYTGAATVCFGGSAFIWYLHSRGALWFSAPAFLTVRAIIELAVIPPVRLLTGAETIDPSYPPAMLVIVIGMAAFWTGSLVVFRGQKAWFRVDSSVPSDRPTLLATVLFGVGLVAKIVIWKMGLASYMADELSRTAAASYIQWLALAANMLPASMIVSAIEIFSKRSKSPGIWIVFWSSLFLCLGFGAISGMKEEVLTPLVELVLVYVLIRRRLPRAALLIPVLLVVMYPFVNAYRDNLNNGYRASANSVDGLSAVLQKTISDATSPSNDMNSGVSSSSERLSLLTPVRLVMSLPSPSLLQGDEKLWMIPFYPFVPRAIWKNKPVLNKGQRFTEALGQGRQSSTAISPFADLYLEGGYRGLVAGMFIYGMVLQLLVNWMVARLSPKVIFLYVSTVLMMINLEADVFSLATSFLNVIPLYMVIAQLIYGGAWLFPLPFRRERSQARGGTLPMQSQA